MLFGRKRKNNTELDEAFRRVESEIKLIEERDDPRKIEHYILDACEHIVATTKEVEARKAEYRSLAEYMEDVDKIVDLDTEKRARLSELVDNVQKLTNRKQTLHNSKSRLSDEEFALMQEREDLIIDDIKRLEENEIYRSKVDGDIKFLEAEKSRWEIEKDDLSLFMSRLRIVSIAIFAIVIAILFFIILIPAEDIGALRLPLIVAMFAGAVIDFFIFMLMGKKRKEYRAALKKLNQSISLLNVERMRYVNVSKAIQYKMSIYDVRSSAELAYLWEQYVLMVKDKENYRKNNLDLAYYVERLYKLFKRLNLRFEKKWIEQVDLMLDENRLRDLHSGLREKMERLESDITVNSAMIKSERNDIDRMMKDHEFYVPEVMEIIESVDKLCGISAMGVNSGMSA